MKSKLLCLLILGMFSSISQAQDVLSLEECIEIAVNNNLQLKEAKLNHQQNKNDYTQAKFNYLPSVNGQASHSYNYGRNIDPFTNQFVNQRIQSNSFSFNGNWTLFNGLNNFYTLKQNANRASAGQKAVESTQNQVILDVATAFLNILQRKDEVLIAKINLQSTEMELDNARKRYKSGAESKLPVYNLEAQKSQDEFSLTNAKNALEQAKLGLSNLLRLPPEVEFDVANPEVALKAKEIADNPARIFETALQQMPEIQQAEAQKEAALYGQKVSASNMYPRLSVLANLNTVYSESRKEITGTYYTGNRVIGFVESTNQQVVVPDFQTDFRTTPFNQQVRDNFGQSFGFQLSVPIFNNYRNMANFQNAKIQHSIADIRLEQSRQQLKNDVYQAWQDYQAAWSNYSSALQNENALKNNFEFSQKRYEAGLLSTQEYLRAKNDYNNSQITLNQSKYNLYFRQIIVDFYKGEEISLSL